MIAIKYFVSFFLDNKINDGWAYKVVGSYASLDLAKKAYFGELENFIGSEAYDNVAVTLNDSYGNTLYHEWWTAEEPEPAITIVSITKEGNVYTVTYSDGRVETFTEPEEDALVVTPV